MCVCGNEGVGIKRVCSVPGKREKAGEGISGVRCLSERWCRG